MNFYFLTAGGLLILLALIHSIVGEKLIVIPLLKRTQPPFFNSEILMKQTIRMAWHMTSILAVGMAFVLMDYGLNKNFTQPGFGILWIIIIANIIGGLASLILVRGKHFSWFVLLLIAALTFLGMT